jgi:hypothetical protein
MGLRIRINGVLFWTQECAFLSLKDAGNFLTSWGTVSFSRRTLTHRVSQSVSQLVS